MHKSSSKKKNERSEKAQHIKHIQSYTAAQQPMSRALCVKLHLRDGRTDEDAFLRPSVRSFARSFVRLSLSVVSVRGVHPTGERTAMRISCICELGRGHN